VQVKNSSKWAEYTNQNYTPLEVLKGVSGYALPG
jgi:hypothetical protein